MNEIWYLIGALYRSQLKGAILEEGIPFNREYGMHAFEYPDLDPRFNKVLNTTMFNHTTIVMKKILQSYKGFEQLTQLVDIGGGLGVTLNLIISRYSNIKGTYFDLPHVIQHAPAYPGIILIHNLYFSRFFLFHQVKI